MKKAPYSARMVAWFPKGFKLEVDGNIAGCIELMFGALPNPMREALYIKLGEAHKKKSAHEQEQVK